MRIKKINIVCHSHYDVNGMDHPAIVSTVNKKIINRAIDLILKYKTAPRNERFRWTAESAAPVMEWWAEAVPDRRRKLIELIEEGYFEVCCFPYNVSTAVGEEEVAKLVNWLPSELYDAFNVKTAIQSGVDGISAAAVNKFISKGLRYVWVMPSAEGNLLRNYPFVFNWKITPTARILAFQNGRVGNFSDFLIDEGRSGSDIKSNLLALKHMDEASLFSDDDDEQDKRKRFVAEAYVKISEYVDKLEKGGEYPFSTLPMSFVGGLCDANELPVEDVVEFVKLWNDMEFTPALSISTAGGAFAEIEVEAAVSKLPTFRGQWPDSMAYKLSSMPKEISLAKEISRLSKQIKNINNHAHAANEEKSRELISRDITAFYEHNFPVNDCDKADPFLFGSSRISKAAPLHRAYGRARYLLNDKIRYAIDYDKDGIYVYNPSECNLSAPVEIPVGELKGDFVSLMERDTMAIQALRVFRNSYNEDVATFWSDVPAFSYRYYALMTLASPESSYVPMPDIEMDDNGWPIRLIYSAEGKIKTDGLCDVISCPDGSCGEFEESIYGLALTSEYDKYATVIQSFENPAVGSGMREMTIWKEEPRVNIKITFSGRDLPTGCAIYARFSLDPEGGFPITSSGGMVFDPSTGIIYGSVLDNIPCDGWVSYPHSKMLLFSKDTASLSFGKPNYRNNIKDFTADKGEVYMILYSCQGTKGDALSGNCDLSFSFDIMYEENADNFDKINKLYRKCCAKLIPIVYN